MTHDPYAAPRPSEEHEPGARTVSYWATLDTLTERAVSPSYDDEEACHRWIRTERVNPDAEPNIWRRTTTPNGSYEDEHVWPPEPEGVQRDHLNVITRSLSEVLSGTKRRRDLPSTGARGSGHVPRPARTMDPLATRAVPYDLLYDENGNRKLEVDENGWIIGQVEDKQ